MNLALDTKRLLWTNSLIRCLDPVLFSPRLTGARRLYIVEAVATQSPVAILEQMSGKFIVLQFNKPIHSQRVE